ncbi:TadE-like protein [Cryobacterium psychrotolerans]|uniref:TadE-like protein n=1 Tax=Cryobacterium psychrotolerans TaxID=386301 RepID=A0A1G9C3R7_9MICO|nr:MULTISPECIES: TadE family type IV pilus minor pilin [Cryobacterium]TFD43718.1 hypothetical protein E3T33_10100 [Cryobacterium sp. TMT1-2-1]TFD84170.1 hypothetical protein E3T56_10715 [Cryobacterium psychrotolerans]SDK45955.1 TadE-like protein [Cryobacterium psychrotolerans]
MRSAWGSGHGRDDGTVTAEFAVVLPAVLLVLACCLGAVQVVGQQVRLTDAAGDAARLLARGESAERAASLVHRSVGGARLATERRGEFVCARLSAPAAFGPYATFGLTVAARSCALGGAVVPGP